MDVVNQTDVVTRNIKHYLEHENQENGLLEDVETIIKSYKSDEPIDTPCIWINKQETVPYDKNNLSNTQSLQTTYEFVCIDYDEDLETAQGKSENLAARVLASILRNFNKIREDENDPLRIFLKVSLKNLTVGSIPIRGKLDGIPASSVTLDFVYSIDWLKCRKL